MAQKKFRCPRCTRTFSMKAHLGRHMSTIHGAASAKKPTAKKRGPGRPPGSGANRSSFAGAPGTTGIIREMQSYRNDLAAQRNAIDEQLGALETAITAMGGVANSMGRPAGSAGGGTGARKRGRPKGSGGRAGSLKDAIAKVLSQRSTPLSPREISQAVVKSGYKSKAQDLTKAVSNVLPDVKGIKRLGFGKYTV